MGLYTHNVSGDDYGISFTNVSGNILQVNKGDVKFYRNAEWITAQIENTTLAAGTGYVDGLYTSVPLTGGSGDGFLGDITVAFNAAITTAGLGYTDAEYENVNLTTVSSAASGALQTINIVNGGTNYAAGTYTNVPVNGGTGSNGTVDVTITGTGVTAIVPNNVGSGYTASDTITLNQSDLGGNLLSTIGITAGGTGYTDGSYLSIPLVNTSGSGINATANFTVSGGVVTAASVASLGSGYTTSDVFTVDHDDLTITTATGISISGAGTGYANGVYNNVSATMSNTRTGDQGTGLVLDITVSGNQATGAVISGGGGQGQQGTHWQVGDTVTVLTGAVGGTGAGILATTTIYQAGTGLPDGVTTGVNLTGGSGSGAQATVEVVGGSVAEVTITNGGLGYATTDTNIGLTGYSGVVLYAGTLATPSGMEFTVSSISIGSGLVLDATAVLTGTGLNLQVGTVASGGGGTSAQATITVDQNFVSQVVITNAGTGYSIGDTVRVADADMIYTDQSGAQLTSAVPTQQMLLTVTEVGAVTVVSIIDSGEGYKVNDVLTTTNTNLGGTGDGFSLTVDTIVTETTVSIDEKLGSITVKQLNSDTFTIGNSLVLTEAGINKTTAGNFLLGTATNNYVQISGTQAFIVPVGDTAQRPAGVSGMMRFNSENLQFEGHNGISFVSLGGVRDVDLDTFISAELNTADDDDTFRFFNQAINTIILDKDKYILNNVDEIDYTDLNGVNLWVEGTAVVSPFAVSTFDGSSSSIVDVNAETITLTSHNLTQGVVVTYAQGTGGSAVGGLTDGQTYHVEVVDANTIKLAADAVDLANDSFINFSVVGSGTAHTLTPDASTVVDILYYYGDNVYGVTGTGTFDASASNPPTHTTGAVANGTAELTWRRTRFSSPVFSGKDINNLVETFGINSGSIRFSSTATNAIINSNKDTLDIGFDVSGTDKVLFGATKTGGIFVNTGYVAGTTSNTEILDYELKEFTLKDTKLLTADATLDTSIGNATSIAFKPYTEGFSGKFMVEIKDNSATPKRQFSEISFLCTSDGASILFTEVSKIYTDEVLCDVSVDIVANNITLIVQDSQNSSTAVYTVKAIHNSILV